jgi:ParB family transcriptional regulator, chromosome partitioning protein
MHVAAGRRSRLIKSGYHASGGNAAFFCLRINFEKPKYSVEQISVKTAKSPPYVAARLKLTELAPVVVEAFYREEIGVGHALLLATLQPGQLGQALAACFKEDWSAGGQKPGAIIRLVATGPDVVEITFRC